jgi:hypothetical protein
MWASGHNGHIRRAAYGYEPTREATMAGECALDAQDPALRDIRQPRDLSRRGWMANTVRL